MTFKIPRSFVFPIVIIIIIVGLLWLSNQDKTSSTPLSQPPLTIQSSPSLDQEIREIDVIAKQFEFDPNPIQVRLGEVIKLNITSTDVTHGFSLPAFGINQTLPPGETIAVQFQATQKGDFPFSCSVTCGSGHSGMKGTLIVE